jgi:hypothetical protein
MLLRLIGCQAGIGRNKRVMQPGAEYIVILNDRQLREAHVQRRPKEARARWQCQTNRLHVATPLLVHVFMAIRASLMRFRRLNPSTPVVTVADR